MNKEDMIHILNQHGIDVLYEVFQNNIELSYRDGYECGFYDGCDMIHMLTKINVHTI